MNENLIDIFYDGVSTPPKLPSQPHLFVCEDVISEQQPSHHLNSGNAKVTSETQTFDENYLEITPDDFMENRVVSIEPTPYTVSQGFFTSYKLYSIMSKKMMDSAFNCKVNRRFSDFEWLSQTLINKYPGYIIPEIPEKNFLASMNFEKSEFIEARRRDLENFLGKLLEHRYLRNAEEVRAFILDDEKEFSIAKGKSELKLKGYSINFTKELVNYLGKRGSYLKKQNDEDKDLQNYRVFFTNTKEKAESLCKCVEELIGIKEGDLKSIAGIDIVSSDLIQNMELLEEMHNFSEKKMRNLQCFVEILETKTIIPLKNWIKTSSEILAALKRREILDDEVFEDMRHIEEMRRTNLKTNNKRDIEMDLLQTRLDNNQKLLIKTTKTLISEICEYQKTAEAELCVILRGFHESHAKFLRDGGFIY